MNAGFLESEKDFGYQSQRLRARGESGNPGVSVCLGLEARTSKYQDSGSKFQVSTCGSVVRQQERDRDLLSQKESKEAASGFKDLVLVWVPVVWV